MKKVFVVVVQGEPPLVYSNRGEMLKELATLKLPFEPTIHECEVQKRVYNKRRTASPEAIDVIIDHIKH